MVHKVKTHRSSLTWAGVIVASAYFAFALSIEVLRLEGELELSSAVMKFMAFVSYSLFVYLCTVGSVYAYHKKAMPVVVLLCVFLGVTIENFIQFLIGLI